MASVIYNIYKKSIRDGDLDLAADTIKVALVTSSYTVDIDAHLDFADITNEISGTGYTAGGATLTTKTVTQDDTNNRGVFDADDVTWAVATFTARGAVVYQDTGTPATSILMFYIDFAEDKSPSEEDFTITWASTGIEYGA